MERARHHAESGLGALRGARAGTAHSAFQVSDMPLLVAGRLTNGKHAREHVTDSTFVSRRPMNYQPPTH